ncbi:MAG: NADH-quinone oxidoreductase subunit N, partial [Opitutales bacterium]
MDYLTLLEATLPDLVVVVALFAGLGVDYGLGRGSTPNERGRAVAGVTSLGLLLALVLTLRQFMQGYELRLGEGQLVLDATGLAGKSLIYGLALIVTQFAARHAPSAHASEYHALLLLAALGMSFLSTTENLLLSFVALELISLSLYALTAFNGSSPRSTEAALKYFAFGGVASAFFVFGLSYLYGATGSLDMGDWSGMEETSALFALGLAFALVGLSFKLAVAPFHLWAPDVYQCAPTPVAAWVASGSKIASVFFLVRLVASVPISQDVVAMISLPLALGAILSMLIGNLGALRQNILKRLLAYASIANGGYLLIGLLAISPDGYAAALFYVAVYALANVGAFGVVGLLSDRMKGEGRIEEFNGCWKRHPGLSFAFLLFILSSAGIPPLAGFVGKYYLFFAAFGQIDASYVLGDALNGRNGWMVFLVALALAMSVVSLYYYVKVLKAFLVSDDESPHLDDDEGISPGIKLCVFALALLVLIL